MSTGDFENWAGNIVDIGPIYPMVGTEFVLWIIGIATWIIWHVVQSRKESAEWEKDLKEFGGKQLPGEEYFDH